MSRMKKSEILLRRHAEIMVDLTNSSFNKYHETGMDILCDNTILLSLLHPVNKYCLYMHTSALQNNQIKIIYIYVCYNIFIFT